MSSSRRLGLRRCLGRSASNEKDRPRHCSTQVRRFRCALPLCSHPSSHPSLAHHPIHPIHPHLHQCLVPLATLLSPPPAPHSHPCPWCPVVPWQVLQPTSSPSWLLGLLYSLLLLAHAAPLIIIAMACGLLEAPAVSRLFEIETHGANRTEVWYSLRTPD